MNPGYVYVLSNESMPGLVKVGVTTKSAASRARALYQTGVPTPFLVECEVLVPDCHELERDLHLALSAVRVNDSREFFRCEAAHAAAIAHSLKATQERSYETTAADVIEKNRVKWCAISDRTKAALAAAKARGVALGWSMPERKEEQRLASRKGAASNAQKADKHAANVLPIIRQIAAGGASLRRIADELNARGIKTARGGLWYATTVRNIMARENEIEAAAK